jgi:hypothetical protein
MTIQADVRGVAQHFGVDPALLQAVVNAEGNILRAVQCAIPSCQTREKALEITCRSMVHAMRDYLSNQRLNGDFVAFWSKRWAPVGAENDPTHLNANWTDNVRKLWGAA